MSNVKALTRERRLLPRSGDDDGGSNSSLESIGALASKIGKMNKYEDVAGRYDASASSSGKKDSSQVEPLTQSSQPTVDIARNTVTNTVDSRVTRCWKI
ncbi:hypothetical protein QE152_g19509 [Popillia japonica]|uniref:Uncharacterized protein n=1 Tax=Popillia japonica TaxID=7064 RepID=A0AAW1KPW7_POPJA